MEQRSVTLEGLPGELVDLDVDAHATWVAVCRGKRADFVVASAAGEFAIPDDVRFPIVRWWGEHVLLVDRRTTKRRDNAFVFTTTGRELARACIGDGIEDVLVGGDRVVVTYFDEGVFGSVGPSHEGLCVFDAELELEFGYQSAIRDAVDICDCYCACLAGPHEVCFSPYTDFPLVRLNLKTRKQQVIELPPELEGASALATEGTEFFFHSPYATPGEIFHWKSAGEAPVPVGAHSGLLRGHGRGTFITIGATGYTIVDPAVSTRGGDEG